MALSTVPSFFPRSLDLYSSFVFIMSNNYTHATRINRLLYQTHLHAAAHGHGRVGLGTEGSIREPPPLLPAPTVWFGNAAKRT